MDTGSRVETELFVVSNLLLNCSPRCDVEGGMK